MKLVLPIWLIMDKKISLLEYKQMKVFMEKHDVWRYKIKQKDFYRIRDGKKIIAFWRIFKIGFKELELWSVWVDEKYRGKKLWLILAQELIADKKWDSEVFLATRRELEKYYQSIWFAIVTQDIPEKLVHTRIRAESQGIDFIMMKWYI